MAVFLIRSRFPLNTKKKVADREAKIASNEDSMKTETGIRTKENGAFQEAKAYMETTLDSLHTAVEVGRETSVKIEWEIKCS